MKGGEEMMEGNLEQTTVGQEIGIIRSLIGDIRNHVIEGQAIVAPGGLPAQNPRAMYTVVNIKNDLREIQASLEDILKAVSCL